MESLADSRFRAPLTCGCAPHWWALLSVNLATAVISSFRSLTGSLIVPLHEQMGFHIDTVARPAGMGLICMALTQPFAMLLVNLVGVKKTFQMIAVLFVVAAGGTGLVTAPWQLWPLWAMGGVAMGLLATPSQYVVFQFFEKHQGAVVGITTAMPSAGMFFCFPAILSAIDAIGWRAACLSLACLGLPTLVLVSFYLADSPAEWGLHPYGADVQSPVLRPPKRLSPPPLHQSIVDHIQSSFVGPARSPIFWVITFVFGTCGYTSFGIVQTHFVATAHEHGMMATSSGFLIEILAVADIVGCQLSGAAADAGVAPKHALAFIMLFRGLTMYLMPELLAPALSPWIIINVVVLGLDYFATGVPIVKLCATHFGRSKGPAVFGWTYAMHQIFAAVGSVVPAYQYERDKTYNAAWHLAAAVAVMGSLLALGGLPVKSSQLSMA